ETMAAEAPIIDVAKNGTMPRLFYTYIDKEKNFIGEDFAFCDDYCERFQANITVWPDLNFVQSGYECKYHAFLNKLVEAEDQGKSIEKDHFKVLVDGEVSQDE